jgi:paraquat-inducible protein B
MDNMPPSDNYKPVVKRRSPISVIWLIPLLTLGIGVWLVTKTLSEQGPVVTISFRSAEGVEAGKTRIKYKNVDIGLVEAVNFTKDLREVVLTVKMEREASEFLRRGSNFWVVRPRLGLRGASGLGTLISGTYIELEPGDGAEQDHFKGLEEPPVVKFDEAGIEIVLQADRLSSVDIGSPVYYRGILAGEVQGYELGNDRRSVFIHVFIKAPFDELVKGNSRFWNVSGIDIALNSEGFNMRTDSFQSMLLGGIEFDTPQSIETSTENVEELVFTLHESYENIEEQSFTRKVNFVLFFDGSVRGLNIGAPVEFKGIRVGKVVDVRLEFDPQDTSFRIPVLIEIEPERVISKGEANSPYKVLKTLVDRGLRARLETGSLLTGKLYVELDMHPDTPIRLVSEQTQIPELPTIPAELKEITTSLKSILAKLEKFRIDEIGDELLGTMQGMNTLANNPDLQQSVTEMKQSMAAFRSVMQKLDPKLEPMAETFNEAMTAGRDALNGIHGTLEHLDNLLQSDSPVQFRIIQMAEEMTEAARSLRIFLDMLEDNPQSLIFGKGENE